jgi:hypothetical protein
VFSPPQIILKTFVTPRLGVKNYISFPWENISTIVLVFLYKHIHDFTIKINPEMKQNCFSENKISKVFASGGSLG